jgi:chromosome segregation ATPase
VYKLGGQNAVLIALTVTTTPGADQPTVQALFFTAHHKAKIESITLNEASIAKLETPARQTHRQLFQAAKVYLQQHAVELNADPAEMSTLPEPGCTECTKLSSKVATLKQQAQQLKTQLTSLRKKLTTASNRSQELKAQVKGLNKQVGRTEATGEKLALAQQESKRLQTEIAKLKKENSVLKKRPAPASDDDSDSNDEAECVQCAQLADKIQMLQAAYATLLSSSQEDRVGFAKVLGVKFVEL